MIETALVYIHGAGERNRFFGCGVVVEGSFIATCRHVWRDATGGDDAAGAVIEFPRAREEGQPARRAASLASACNGEEPALDLVLLAVDRMPPGVTALHCATSDFYETGAVAARARVRRKTATGKAEWLSEVHIPGEVPEGAAPNERGLRQFSARNPQGYWFGRGSSGSPIFVAKGQQLAGLLSLAELGEGDGDKPDSLEAFLVPGTAIRRHLQALVATPEADRLSLPRAQLLPLLEEIGAADAPLAEIPARLHAAVIGARALATETPPRSNDGTDIDATIGAARAQAGDLKLADALGTLDAKLAEEEALRAQRLLPLLRERARIQGLAFDRAGRGESLARIAELAPDDPWAWFALGDHRWEEGQREGAKAAYARGRDAAARAGDQRDLSVSHDRIGDVLLAEGQREAALASYRASLSIREALARQDPGNAEWQRDLSVSHNKIGDVLLAEGQREAALASYRASLSIAEALARQDPGNAAWQRDLSVSHNRIGDVLLAEGQREAALASYRASLSIREALARQDPGNAAWQRDLSVSHDRIGDVLLAEGQREAALASYRASLSIREALARQDPGNAEWQRDLSVSHNKIGDVLLAEGQREAALASYRASLSIAEALARQDPGNAAWQRDLSVSHNRIGDVLLAEGQREAALASYRASLSIAEALARQDPGNAAWQRDLSVSHNRIGDVLLAEGQREAALASYRASLSIREALARQDPGNAAWQRDLSVSHNRIGDVLLAEGQREAALASYRASLSIREALARQDPGNAAWQRDLSVSHNKIGDVLLAEGQREAALASYRASLSIREALARQDPGNAAWQRDLIVSFVKLSETEPDKAAAWLQRALDVARALAASGRLAPADAWMPADIERRLRYAGG